MVHGMTTALTRSLSLTQLIFYGVGTIVGAGNASQVVSWPARQRGQSPQGA